MDALVIGGTGPTGPHIIDGLIERGYRVAMLNRGSRDSSAVAASVERIVADPHFRETLERVLAGRSFDLVIATYGRIRHVADAMVGRTGRLITVGGPPSYRGFADPDRLFPPGLPVPVPEEAARVDSEAEHRFGYLIRVTEDAVLAHHAAGDYNATHFRYPVVYGPRQVRAANVWWIMRRCLDRRPFIVLPDGGLTLITRGYTENMAHAILLAADQPDAAAGQIYNCGDELQLTLAQWVALVADEMDWPLEVIGVPDVYASPARDYVPFRGAAAHQLLDLHKVRHQLGYADRVGALEATRRTVRWCREHPPEEDDAFREELAAHYRTEEALAAIHREACERMAALPHYTRGYHHAYAHPKQPGLARDHRDR